MGRAVHLPIHRAHCLMRRAHRLAAARAWRNLVHAHGLVGSALTVPNARGAQAAAPLRGVGMAALRVPVADVPPAAAARRETRGARPPAVPPPHPGGPGPVPPSAGAPTPTRAATPRPTR